MARLVTLSCKARPTKASPKRKVWEIRWHDSRGKQLAETVGEASGNGPNRLTKRQAEKKRADKEAEFRHGLVKRDRPKDMKLGEFIEYDAEAIKSKVAHTTLLNYATAGKHLITSLGADTPIRKIDRAAVGRLMTYLKEERKVGVETQRKNLRACHALLARAVQDSLIETNPFKFEKRSALQAKTPRFFSAQEVAAMIEVSPSTWWDAIIRLAVVTGLRRGELWHLRWCDVDFEERVVRVTRRPAGTFKLGEESLPILEWKAKTHQERQVEVDDATLEQLGALRRQIDFGASEYVFIGVSRLRRIRSAIERGTWRPNSHAINNFTKHWKKIQADARAHLAKAREVKVADVPWKIGCWHDLRKTYGNRMKRHVSPDVLMKLMGHSNIATTMKYYVGTTDEDTALVRAALTSEFALPIHGNRVAIEGENQKAG